MLDNLFLAIYFNDLDRVKAFKNEHPEMYARKNRYTLNWDDSIDLTNLTLFNTKFWFKTSWNKEIMTFVEENKVRTLQMTAFWEEEGEVPIKDRKFEYNKYFDYFFCEDPNNPDRYDKIDLDPISSFLEKGFREIDLQLNNAIECFDFVETKRLLERGAQSNVHICEGEYSDPMSRILGEISFLSTCRIFPNFEAFKERGYDSNFDIIEMFGELLGYAAHEDMYQLLKRYN